MDESLPRAGAGAAAAVEQPVSTDVLNKKIRRSYVWTTLGTLSRQGITFGISILLARLLEPAHYGLIGMVTVFTAILSVLQDFGIGQARVCFDDDDSALPTYYFCAVSAGVTMALVAFLGAPLVAAFYHEPRLTALLQWLGLSLAFGGLRSVSQGILTKRFNFRDILMIESVATAAGGVLAIVLAFAGFGVWSLVANTLCFEAARTLLFCIAVPPRFSLSIDKEILKKLLRWGTPVMSSSLLWQFWDNSDFLVVGKTLGPVQLGLYTLAFRYATLVNQRISPIINRVSLPSFAALKHDKGLMLEHWFLLSRNLVLVNFPLLAALFVGGDDLLLSVLGDKWAGAIVPLRLLCLAGMTRTLTPLLFILCSVQNRTDLGLKFTLMNVTCLPPAFYIGSKYAGLWGIGLGWGIHAVLACIQLTIMLRMFDRTLLDYIRNLRFPLVVTLVCFFCMLPAKLLDAPAFVRLCVLGALGGTAYGACLLSQESFRRRARGLLRTRVRA